MRRTLLLIPHEIAGIPVLGFGWMLMAVILAVVVRLGIARRGGERVAEVLRREGLIWGLFAAAIVWVLPMVELTNLDGQPVGLAIRGYGMMLLLGVSAAIGLAAYRARQRGMDPEDIFSMAPWAFIGGIIGARLFYVIQYRDQYIGETIGQTLGRVFKFTEGGLVVYGAFIGGFVALTYYIIRRRLSWLKFGDVIVPCMFLGVFFGRIGCLLNGCCYGGRCEDLWSVLRFPPTSKVYDDQLRSGELLGFTYDAETRRIESVREGSLADQAGIQVGSRIGVVGSKGEVVADDLTSLETASREIPQEDVRMGVIATIDGKRYRWSPGQLPDRALPVYAAQVLSSVSSLVLCLLLCGLSVFKYRDGTVMMLGFAAYAVLRFALERVRVDEAGQFGTELSISQWVSMFVFGFSIFGMWWIYRTPPTAAVQRQASRGT